MTVENNDTQLLAAEYVVGTLDSTARAQVEQQLLVDPELSAEIAWWEKHLAGLNTHYQPVAAPQQTWQKLQKKMFNHIAGFWRPLAIAASVATVFVSAALVYEIQKTDLTPELAVGYTAVFVTDNQQPGWLVRINDKNGQILLEPLSEYAVVSGKSLELWLLHNDGSPSSLGLVSTQQIEQRNLPNYVRLDRSKKILAISLEPSGGSPTGVPTGPVLYTAPVVKPPYQSI